MGSAVAGVVLPLLLAAQLVFSGHLIEYLPGYNGKLPFKLETGYISVGDSEMFYYFIESQGNPKQDPLLLWLAGGPGCSSLYAILYENGPLEFDITNYDGALPALNYYPYAWTKTASIVFLDSPVGTGFSYPTTSGGWATSDSKAAKQAYEFFLKWLEEHPQYLPLETYISGVSYPGIIVPQVTKFVVQGLEAQVQPRVNLKGYLLVSPRTDSVVDENSKITFAHRMGLLSEEAAKERCHENYVDVEPSNTDCVLAVARYHKCVKDIYTSCILEPKCTYAAPHEARSRKTLQATSQDFILSPPKIPHLWCRNFNYVLPYHWANDLQVREALHVRKGTVPKWLRCNDTLDYTKDRPSVVYDHKYLTNKRLNVLVESGDRDMVVPFVGTEQWIKSLNLTIDEEWRPWFVDGQVYGEVLHVEKWISPHVCNCEGCWSSSSRVLPQKKLPLIQ